MSQNSRFDAEMLCRLPEKLRDTQAIFGRTGGLHAAALFRADGERSKSELIVHRSVDYDVLAAFVGDEPIQIRVEENGVADCVAVQMRIEMRGIPASHA